MKKILSNHEDNNKNRIFLITLLIMFSTSSFAQIQTEVPSLKDVYANDFYIGCILSYRHVGFPNDPVVPGQSSLLYSDGEGGSLVKFHMNSMSPGNNMKAQYTIDIAASAAAYIAAVTQAQRDSIETHPVVRFNGDLIAQLNWAQRQGFTFRGHVLVWHNQAPSELFLSGYSAAGTRLSKAIMIERMENYIKEVIRLLHESWPGLLSAMDVVNEAVNDGTGTDRTTSEWYQTFGDNSYIMKAFEFARKYSVQYGETQMKLYYNDYNDDNPSKANGIVRICGPVFRAGYLDGIGRQGHDANSYPTAAQWIDTYNKFDTICTEMSITEFYVNQQTTSPSSASLTAQANQYAMLFKLYLDRSYFSGRGKIINLTKDGLNDQWTLFPNSYSSLWDADNQCKPAFYAVANVGINYHALDSLISYADTMQESTYSPVPWANLVSALASAKNAMVQNYSSTISAADVLSQAKSNLQTAISGLATGIDKTNNKISTFTLYQNYPNPFNPSTIIKYSLAKSSHIKLTVYNVLGQKIKTLADGFKNAGEHSIVWDATDDKNNPVSVGIYFYRFEAGTINLQKKMALLK